MEQNFNEIVKNIDRFPISDLHEELVMCRTSKSRIPEIKRLYKNVLGEGIYYNICYNNPAYEFIADAITYRNLTEDMKHISNMSLKKNFKFYGSNMLNFLDARIIKVADKFYPVIKQSIEPTNAYEFHHMYEWSHYYMLDKHVEEIKDYLKNAA